MFAPMMMEDTTMAVEMAVQIGSLQGGIGSSGLRAGKLLREFAAGLV